MTDGKTLREELADTVRDLKDNEVAAAVRELRAEVEKLRAERETHHCHSVCCPHWHCNWGHCGCFTVHSYAVGPAQPYGLPHVWYGTVTAGNTWGGDCTVTNTASGYNPGSTTLSVSN